MGAWTQQSSVHISSVFFCYNPLPTNCNIVLSNPIKPPPTSSKEINKLPHSFNKNKRTLQILFTAVLWELHLSCSNTFHRWDFLHVAAQPYIRLHVDEKCSNLFQECGLLCAGEHLPHASSTVLHPCIKALCKSLPGGEWLPAALQQGNLCIISITWVQVFSTIVKCINPTTAVQFRSI